MGLQRFVLDALKDRSLSALQREELLAKLLNYNPRLAESRLKSNQDALYPGLEDVAFSTPFYDYYQALSDLKKGETMADLGAGHCKGSLLSAVLKMPVKCLSYELASERLEGARRALESLGLIDESLFEHDILMDDLPKADAYFLYLPLGPLIYRPIQALLTQNCEARFYVVESHGDILDFFNSLPKWFTYLKTLPSEANRHKEGIHVYKFVPRAVEVRDFNSSEFLYPFISAYAEDREVKLVKESGAVTVAMKELLPLMHNGQMSFECLSLMRIVDYRNVRIVGT